MLCSILKYHIDMKKEEFAEKYPGQLVKIPEGILAFVPDPLPPIIDFNDRELINLNSDATLAVGELKGLGRNLQNPYLLIGPLSYREAIDSSELEGTIATAEEVALLEASPTRKVEREEIAEVRNYVRSMQHGLKLLDQLPMSKRLIRELHKQLLQGVRGQERNPGEFRKLQNHIGQLGESPENARFVPPPVNSMGKCLDEFETYLNSERTYPPLVELAIIHYQFEAIHPFMDGNGRVGRLLLVLLLCHWKLLPQPLLYMSGFFGRHKEAYKDLLLGISQRSNWVEWVKFFLRGVVEQSHDSIQRSEKLLSLQGDYRELLQSARSSALTLKLVDSLFETPYLTMHRAASMLGVTNRTSQRHIQKLVETGILEEATGETRNRVYLARDILGIIEKQYNE